MSLHSGEVRQLCQLLIGNLPTEGITSEDARWLLHTAKEHYLAPFVYWRLSSRLPNFPKQAYMKAVARDLAYRRGQAAISNILASHNIPAIWLKGSALRWTVYPVSALRFMADLDVLVPAAARITALDALRDAGFELKPFPHSLRDTNKDALADRHHHFILRSKTELWLVLEVHFHLLGAAGRALLSQDDLELFFEQSLPHQLDRQTVFFPQPELHLTYLCAHAALQHGLQDFDLRRYLDVHFLITSTSLDWQAMVAYAVRLRWTYATERVLMIAQDLFDTPFPPDVLDELRRNRRLDEDVSLLRERESDSAEWSRFWYILRQYSWWERIQLMWETAVPPHDYMRHHYAIPAQSQIWPYYLRRWASQLKSLSGLSRR